MKIKPLVKTKLVKKIKKPKAKKISYYQHKLDKLIQIITRKMYKTSAISNRPCEVGHHLKSKGSCSALRFTLKNIVPLTIGEHIAYHNGDIFIAKKIIDWAGEERISELEYEARTKKPQKIQELKMLLENLTKIYG